MSSRTIRSLGALAIVASLSLSATACSGKSDSNNGSSKQVTLALSTLNNPFFISVRDGALEQAKAAGITLNVVDAQNDPATQANQIADAATKNQAGVIVNPVDSDAAGTAVKPLINTKIPVVALDRAVNGAEVTSFIASDNVAGGSQAADALAKAIGETGKVIVLDGVSGTSAARDRGKGFMESIKKYPKITVVAQQPADFDRTKGLDVTTNLMQSNPEVTAIFAANDEMALGAIKALGSKAGSQVKVFGFDGTDEGLKAISAGTMQGTIAQQPTILGKQAVIMMKKAIDKQTVDATVPVAVQTVTAENVKEFLK
ncbi:MAG: substrate-binding domain-containing protein [Propionibacteriaceae bacterium]